MTRKDPRNTAASVRQRLLNLSRRSGEEFQRLLTRYAVERLLDRLSRSEHAPRFVLKGDLLFTIWTGELHRPTRDLDLLGFGESSSEGISEVFRSLCELEVADDGLVFSADTVTVESIREEQEYGGQRVKLEARLGQARIDLQVDVGFGDAITLQAEAIEYPTLLGMNPPRLRAYPRETVVAEKLEALVKLGMANSRMKDFFDLAVLARSFPCSGPVLRDAIVATFQRRGTVIPTERPITLTESFGNDGVKLTQWKAFVSRNGLKVRVRELGQVVGELAESLGPSMIAAAKGEAFDCRWEAGGPWRPV
ncbi:MAG: nucleotidyl transferase AbiEii/AbiGii toxin family protein [Isosphaeraceae bacterium]